ncbi:hypothetical protein LINPERPRIM_LOCUS33699 [Linum perenne]
MSLSLLRNPSPEALPELQLCLLHGWKMRNPARIEQFFAYATLWVDSEGFRVQGDSHRNFATALQKRITVGAVYKVTCYALCPPRSSFRACRFPHCIQITPSTKFELQPPTDPPFLHDTYDFVEFPLLRDRLPPSPYLAGPTYVYFLLLVFGLYALADFLLIFPCFPDLVGKVVGVGKPNHVDSNAKTAPVQTIRLADAGGSEVNVSLWSELAYIIDPDTITLDDVSAPVIIGFSCIRISTFDAPNGVDFWCPTHDTISSADITYRYRLKLYVSDSTTETMFVLLGQAADRILPISAMELIRAYPDVYGELPPPIEILVDQTVTFEVQLPRHLHANTYGDFKVSKIWGLKIPRDKILSQIPKPLPLPLPSSMVVQLTVQKSHPKAAPKSHKKKTPSVAAKKSSLNESTIPMHLESSATPPGLLDDVPLRFFVRAKRLSKDTLAPPTPDAANL